MAVGYVVLVAWLFDAASGPEAYAKFLSVMDSTIGCVLLVGWSFAFFYHLCERRTAPGLGYGPRSRERAGDGVGLVRHCGIHCTDRSILVGRVMSLRSPLGRVLGLGTAKDGTGHWWGQRVSGVALAVLGLWFAWSFATMSGFSHVEAVTFIGKPVNALLLLLLSVTMAYHSYLGVRSLLRTTCTVMV